MKHITLTLLAISFFPIVSCDQQKAAIDANNKATQNAIDDQKEAVDTAARNATKQTEINATIDKANIEAEKITNQAQLDADKKKSDADAIAKKAQVDAEQQ